MSLDRDIKIKSVKDLDQIYYLLLNLKKVSNDYPECPMKLIDRTFKKGKLTTEFINQLSHKASKTSPHKFLSLILRESLLWLNIFTFSKFVKVTIREIKISQRL